VKGSSVNFDCVVGVKAKRLRRVTVENDKTVSHRASLDSRQERAHQGEPLERKHTMILDAKRINEIIEADREGTIKLPETDYTANQLRRYICIVCPNCNKTEPVPVYKVKFDGRIFWVCRSCTKWFPCE